MHLVLVAFLCFAQEPVPDIPQLMQAGDAAYLKGDYEAARLSFAKALELADQTPPDNPVRYDVLKKLSSVRAAAGEFKDADDYLMMAMKWREDTLGPNDAKITDDLLQSVAYCRGMKDYPRALSTLGRVLSRHSKASGYESTDVADDYSRMAQVFMEQKQMPAAVDMLKNAIAIRTKVSGPLHYSLVYDFDRLGQISIALRDYAGAEASYRRSLVIRETLYGKNHPDLIETMDGLAYACFGQKKYDEAEPLYQRLIALWVSSVGADHPMLAVTLDKVAVFYADQKKYDLAKEATERATAIRTAFLGNGLSVAATEQIVENHASEAKALYERALKVLDPPNPLYDELRTNVEGMVKSLSGPALPRAQPKKATSQKK